MGKVGKGQESRYKPSKNIINFADYLKVIGNITIGPITCGKICLF